MPTEGFTVISQLDDNSEIRMDSPIVPPIILFTSWGKIPRVLEGDCNVRSVKQITPYLGSNLIIICISAEAVVQHLGQNLHFF